MKKLTFSAVVMGTASITSVLTVLFTAGYHYIGAGWFLSAAITCGTTFYHFAMRLLVGHLVPNRFSYESRWFQPRPFEAGLYKALRLRRWKGQMPTYNPRLFDSRLYSTEEILAHMCQAEMVHTLIIPLSFLPVATIPLFGEPAVFAITSLLAALFDLLFVMMQRFNRPRLVRLLQRQRRKGDNHV